MSLFAAYERLWRRIQADGVSVHYNGLATDEGGHFQHDGCGDLKEPEIQITRSFYSPPSDEPSEFLNNGEPSDIENELFTLAHEYGHFLSWKRATNLELWCKYHDAILHRGRLWEGGANRDSVCRALSADEKQLIVEEETLAWKLGRPFIPDEWYAAYDEKARRGVHNHRYRLGLDDLWPEDA
jgi:hypothetical protein